MNRIKISDEAVQSLNDGFWFYTFQEKGLEDYFATEDRLRQWFGETRRWWIK